MKIAKISKKGGREVNEDAVGMQQQNGIYCFMLADGLGGHGGGDVASELALRTINECFMAQADISYDIMYAYLEAAQHAITEKRAESAEFANIATTITVLLTDGVRAIWGHCGDSRIYRFKKHRIQEVTDDQSVAFTSFLAGDIKYSQIRYSPDQNKLLHSLSDGKKFKPIVSRITRLDKDSAFLMCSDGLWEYVTEKFMEKTRKKSLTPKEWLKLMLDERKRVAPPDADNYSAIAIFI